MEYINIILNNALYASIFFVIVGALIGLYVKARAQDRCFKDFEGFPVTLELSTRDQIWGFMKSFANALPINICANVCVDRLVNEHD